MRVRAEQPMVWELDFACEDCSTDLTADQDDLRGSRFKKPGTYWFDGSADLAGLDWHYFVKCVKCDAYRILTPEEEEAVPFLLRKELKDAYEMEQRR